MNKKVCKGKERWIALSSHLYHVQPVCWLACVEHYPSLFTQYHFLLTFTEGSDLNIEGNALKSTSVRACFLCSGLHCVLLIKCELSLGAFPCIGNPPELCDVGQCRYYKCASKNCRHIYAVYICLVCVHASLTHRALLIQHKSKDKIIKNAEWGRVFNQTQ